MPINKIQMSVNYRKAGNSKSPNFGKYYAEVNQAETLSTAGFIEHLRAHNCAVGEEAIKAVIAKMSECIPELVAQGQPVRIDGLGIFYPTITNKKAGATEDQMKSKDFSPTSLIKGVHLRFRPEGTDINNLTSKAFLEGHVSPASEFIVSTEKRTVVGKDGEDKNVVIAKYVTLEDFRTPAKTTEP